MLTFEGEQFQGPVSIVQKLSGLPLFKVEPQIDTLDAQPSAVAGAIIIFITGRLIIDNEGMPQRFSQTFQLLPTAGGSYFVFNDIFRLNYG